MNVCNCLTFQSQILEATQLPTAMSRKQRMTCSCTRALLGTERNREVPLKTVLQHKQGEAPGVPVLFRLQKLPEHTNSSLAAEPSGPPGPEEQGWGGGRVGGGGQVRDDLITVRILWARGMSEITTVPLNCAFSCCSATSQ